LSDILKYIQKNVKMELFFNKNNINNHIFEIREIVDDKYVVVKYFLKNKKRWHYEVRELLWFQINKEYLNIKE